ncbi:MAG: 16S rRNA-processing protein [Atopobium sp.]|nr:16S rRNA-processing protein [Atopobium sp.]
MTVPVHSLPSLIAEGMTVVPVPPAAEELVGKTLLVEEDCLPENFGLVNVSLLVGREVLDIEHGSLGEISEVLIGPTQNVWVLEGPFGQVMMPAVDEFIKEAPAEGPITVSIPQGLLRLGE